MTIFVDVEAVDNEQEALVLMLHHLKLAAAYFEATPVEFEIPACHSRLAMLAWRNAMDDLYPKDYEEAEGDVPL